MTDDRVHLVDVTQGITGYTWTTVGQVPLTGRHPGAARGAGPHQTLGAPMRRFAILVFAGMTMAGCEGAPASQSAIPQTGSTTAPVPGTPPAPALTPAVPAVGATQNLADAHGVVATVTVHEWRQPVTGD